MKRKISFIGRLWSMALLPLLLLAIIIQPVQAQVYTPSLHTVVSKPIGEPKGTTDARTQFYDATHFVYRDYVNTTEVLSYLSTSNFRSGGFSIFINFGGTLNTANGIITWGTRSEYWFKDGTADNNLVLKGGGAIDTTSLSNRINAKLSAVLTTSLTINVPGNPLNKNGTTYNSGTSLESMLRSLLNQQSAPTVSASSASPNINLPTTSVTLNGTSSSSGSGFISSVLWTYVSGPSSPTIGGSNTNTASVTGLQEGTYVIRYTATDNLSQASHQDVTQIVTYVLPIVSAGNPQSITSPQAYAYLAGTTSAGTASIASSLWTQDSGPNTATFSSTSSLTPTVSSLIQGTYIFRLTSTDVNSRTNYRQVSITVNAAAILVQFAFPTSDQYTVLQSGDAIDYSGSYSPASNSADWLLDWHAMPQNSFCVIRVLTGTLIRNYYFDSGNPSFNNDTIPGSNCRTFTVRGYDYYTFYTPQNFDTGVNSRATFQHQ